MENDNLAPIVLFVYNRLEHTKKAVEALQNNNLAKFLKLYIFSDGPRDRSNLNAVQEVRKFLHTIKGFKSVTIIEQDINLGLAKSVINGVSKVVSDYGKVIVMEDDLLTSPDFLFYMNKALIRYENNPEIFSVTGFNFSTKFLNIPDDYDKSIFYHKRPMSWSWATWIDRWENCDWEIGNYLDFHKEKKFKKKFSELGEDLPTMLKLQASSKIDSWYVRFCYNSYKQGKLNVYPVNSFVSNIGHDGSGVHCAVEGKGKYLNDVNDSKLENERDFFSDDIGLNRELVYRFNKIFRPQNIIIRAFRKIIATIINL